MKKQKDEKHSFVATVIVICIFFSILSYIWEKFHMLIIIAALVIITMLILYIASVLFDRNNIKPKTPIAKLPETAPIQESKSEIIQKEMHILFESNELMNTSNYLTTVLNRYHLACDTIDRLSCYSLEELEEAGFKLREPLSNTKAYIQNNKIFTLNQAIERNLNSEINSEKDASGKLKKLNNLYYEINKNNSLAPENLSYLKELNSRLQKDIIDSQLRSVPSEISDLIWFGDYIYKNYTPPAKEETYITDTVVFISNDCTEPSAIYMDLPVNKPATNTMVESPPYSPRYKDLSPEQRWEYWQFLSNPFSSQNDVGYAFLFYYGLERHLFSGKLEQAFEIILKMRSYYSNPSFQNYTANALFLTCIVKKRADLARKLIDSYEKDNASTLPMNYLLVLKSKFGIPLTASDIINHYQYFGFTNSRYIKNEPELFHKALSGFLHQYYNADSIDLNEYFPTDIDSLPLEQKEMFANDSLRNYKASAPVYENKKLYKKISSMLYDAHETVKRNLRYGNNVEPEDIEYFKTTDNLFKKNAFKNMTGHDFEKYCARLLSLNGFSSISVTRDSGDQGIDIIAYKEDTKYGIQCKLYSSRVGNSAVQEAYSGKDFYKCQIGAVLTNNDFTESARELADSLGILLWDGNYLYQLQQAIKNVKKI